MMQYTPALDGASSSTGMRPGMSSGEGGSQMLSREGNSEVEKSSIGMCVMSWRRGESVWAAHEARR